VRRAVERRGTIAALVVGVTILVLYIVLQPSDKPTYHASAAPTTRETTTSRPPIEELCESARRFVDSAQAQDENVAARLAETFYGEARGLVSGDVRAEYEAAANYYTEYNNVGEPYDYDEKRIAEAGDADRWTQLRLRPPLGVAEARANVAELCDVDLPPPPTIVTTTTTIRRATTTEPPADSPATPATAATATTAPR
jgi:hypothetical protein